MRVQLVLLVVAYLSGFSPALSQSGGFRIEPPNWWKDMNNDTVQVMVHGDQLGQGDITLHPYPGVRVDKVHRPKNTNYLFVDLVITDAAIPGIIHFFLDSPQEGKDTLLSFPILERASSGAVRETISPKDVLYLITPDRFANGDVTNDIIPGMREQTVDRSDPNARHGGDIQGIRQHLDYLQGLGVTALWINPLLENDMPRMSYHGYAITDFYKIDPRFGTLQDYLDLCREAQSVGIKMVMDMIMNHCGLEHWWMKDLPDDQWINLTNKPYAQTNHLKTAPSDPYAATSDLEMMTQGWFVPTMPDLNVTHPLLAEYLITNTIWWIETARLNGIRMDTYPYPDKEFMRRWAKRVEEEYPGFITVGEVWHYEPSVIAYWQDREDNPDGYRSYLPSVFDFPLQGAIHTAFQEPEGWERGLYKLYEAVSLDFVYPDPDRLVTFADNHDMSRIHTVLGGDGLKTKNALAFLLTFRGIPSIFYGTEVLMTHPGTDAHGAIRADFPGGWPGDKMNGFTSTALDREGAGMQQWLKQLLNFRKTSMALQEGNLKHFAPQEGIYVLFRFTDTEKVMVIIRKDKTSGTALKLDRFAELLQGHQTATDVINGRKYALDQSITLSGIEPIILVIH